MKQFENKTARAKTGLQTVSMLAERSEMNLFHASIANSLQTRCSGSSFVFLLLTYKC